MIQNGALQRDREQGASGRSQCLGSPQTYWTGWMLKAPKHDPRTKDQSRPFFCQMWWNFYLSFKRGSGATYPSEQFQAVYCSINYAHLLILRGFSSAPECNSHSQTVVYSCSKETDRSTTTDRIFLSKSGLHSYCICNEYKSHAISASASACLCVCERKSDSISHTGLRTPALLSWGRQRACLRNCTGQSLL